MCRLDVIDDVAVILYRGCTGCSAVSLGMHECMHDMRVSYDGIHGKRG